MRGLEQRAPVLVNGKYAKATRAAENIFRVFIFSALLIFYPRRTSKLYFISCRRHCAFPFHFPDARDRARYTARSSVVYHQPSRLLPITYSDLVSESLKAPIKFPLFADYIYLRYTSYDPSIMFRDDNFARTHATQYSSFSPLDATGMEISFSHDKMVDN